MSLACRKRHRQCRRIQASQQARCLARAWQLWVDAHWAEQLSRTLVGGLSSSPSCRGPGSSFSHLTPWPTLDKPVSRCGLWTKVRSPCLLTFLDAGPLVTSLSPWGGGRSRRAMAARTRTAKSFLLTLSVAQTVAPGPGLEDMAEKGPSAAGGSAATPARGELGPFSGGSTSPCLASLPVSPSG